MEPAGCVGGNLFLPFFKVKALVHLVFLTSFNLNHHKQLQFYFLCLDVEQGTRSGTLGVFGILFFARVPAYYIPVHLKCRFRQANCADLQQPLFCTV